MAIPIADGVFAPVISFGWWACLWLLMAGPPRDQTKLQNPACSECQNDNSPQSHREQKRYRKRQLPMEDQEVHLYALQVLKDKYKDHDQANDADRERRPRSAEAGLSLARVRFPRLYILVRGTFYHPAVIPPPRPQVKWVAEFGLRSR